MLIRKKFLYLNACMPLLKQKGLKSVIIIRNVALLLLLAGILTSSSGCQLIRSVTQPERSDKVNKRIEKDDRKSYEEARAEFRKKHYKRQAKRTRKRMDYNARKAQEWRENNLRNNKPSVFEKIENWFEWFFGLFKNRDKGLYNN